MSLGSSVFGYNAPVAGSVTYTLTGGATFQSDVKLDNSSPADITLIKWATAGASSATLQAIWSSPIRPGCACLLGVTLPLGTQVTIKGKRSGDIGFPYDLGGNSQSTAVIQLDDGSYAVIWVFNDGLSQILGYEITITNNTSIAASQILQVGEARIFQGYRPGRGIQEKWTPGFDNIQNPQVTVNRQPHVVNHRYNRVDNVIFGITNEQSAWASDNGDISLNRFAHIAATHQTLLAIPVAYVNGALNAKFLANTAIYGYASKVERPQNVGNRMYQMALQFTEYPPQQYG